MFCAALKGEVTLELDGVKRQIIAGDSYVCAVGQKGGARNTGSEPYVERMHHLIKAGQKGEQGENRWFPCTPLTW
jgi:hypothetical protein